MSVIAYLDYSKLKNDTKTEKHDYNNDISRKLLLNGLFVKSNDDVLGKDIHCTYRP